MAKSKKVLQYHVDYGAFRKIRRIEENLDKIYSEIIRHQKTLGRLHVQLSKTLSSRNRKAIVS